MEAEQIVQPPADIPAAYAEAVGKLDPRAQTLYITSPTNRPAQCRQRSGRTIPLDGQSQGPSQGQKSRGGGRRKGDSQRRNAGTVRTDLQQEGHAEEARCAVRSTPAHEGLMRAYTQVFGGPKPHL